MEETNGEKSSDKIQISETSEINKEKQENSEVNSEKQENKENNINNDEAQEIPKIIYRCQQCRAPLFTNRSIIPHEATKFRKFCTFGKRQEFANENSSCTSYFVQKPPWLDATGRVSDNIYCPKCHFKIGHFSWRGSQCSCGEWIKPSFQISMSRVDSL